MMKYVLGSTFLIALALVGWSTLALAEAPQEPLEIKWLIAHEPVFLFDRAVEQFTEEFNKHSDREVHVTILAPKDYGSPNGHLTLQKVEEALRKGDVQMATIVLGGMSKQAPVLQVMNLPYLFDSHESADRVFDGPVGKDILGLIDDSFDMHALAFTFSGGFNVFVSNNNEFKTAADIQGKRIGTVNGPMAGKVMTAFGAVPEVLDHNRNALEHGATLDSYDAMEIPYTRILTRYGQFPKYVFETKHNLFTTTIVASDAFWGGLSDADKTALQKAASVAAVAERADSIALGVKTKKELLEKDTVILPAPPETTAAFKEAAKSVYEAFEAEFGRELIQRIRDAQE